MKKMSPINYKFPIPVTYALRQLGQDICDARRRRRISTALMAERASISRATLHKIEKGEPGVSMGNYATVLFILGLHKSLGNLIDISNDPVGATLEAEALPKRIRRRKNKWGG